MTLEDLHSTAEADLKINRDDLSHASIITPNIFSKYNRILSIERLKLKKATSEFKTSFLNRWEFYRGKAEDSEYTKEQWFKKVLASDVDIYLDGDAVLSELKRKIDYQEEIVDALNRIIKQIGQRDWQIRNAIEFLKFTNGSV